MTNHQSPITNLKPLPSSLLIFLLTTAGFGLGFILGVPVHERSLFAPDFPSIFRNPGNPEALFTTSRPLSTTRPDELRRELDYLLSQPAGPDIDRRLNALFWRWGTVEPATAATAALLVLTERGEDGPIRNVVWSWSRTDPPAAAKWTREFPAPAQREQYLRDAYTTWARSNAPAVAQDVLSLPPTPLQGVAASAVVASYAKVDLAGCRKWVDSLPAISKSRTAPTLVAEWSKQNPAAAAAWAGQLSPPDLQSTALREAGSAWARRDGPAALAYGASLQDGPGKDSFLNAAIRAYVSTKPADAARWLASQSEQPFFERLAKEMISQWLQFDPKSCAAWVVSLPDQGRREKILQDVINQWKKSDPDSAAAFVGSNPSISDDFKSRNLK